LLGLLKDHAVAVFAVPTTRSSLGLVHHICGLNRTDGHAVEDLRQCQL
jgi:hypothetical protein